MKTIDIECSYCKIIFSRSLKNYNKAKNSSDENYKSFCSSICSAKYLSEHSISNFNLASHEKRCTKCLLIKSRECDFSNKSSWCKQCSAEYQRKRRETHKLTDEQKESLSVYAKVYRAKNRKEILLKSKIYYNKNKDKLKITRAKFYKKNKDKININNNNYYLNNKDKVIKRTVGNAKRRFKYNMIFKLRVSVSSSIFRALKNNGSSKKGFSILKFLPYSIKELKNHLEKQFESWMNWSNWGLYTLNTWDDNDPSTWRWNIDHIIPQSKLPYTSMEDENFKKCWALENLRPYSAKQNILDSNKR